MCFCSVISTANHVRYVPYLPGRLPLASWSLGGAQAPFGSGCNCQLWTSPQIVSEASELGKVTRWSCVWTFSQ